MRNIIFFARRALLSQPLGMTVNILRKKVSASARDGPSRSASPLPIDQQYGIETGGLVQASALRTGSPSDLHSVGYGASVPSVIRRGIEACPHIGGASFVDLGCGKGLPLVVASEYPFLRIVGVELSPSLCAIARSNAARIATDYPSRTAIEVVEGDMTTAELPSGYVVVFLYNPAYKPLIRKLAKRLAEHQAAGNKVMVVYYNPAGAQAFDDQPGFARYFAAHLALEPDEEAASELGNVADSIVIWQGNSEPSYPSYPGAAAPVRLVAGGSAGQVEPAGS